MLYFYEYFTGIYLIKVDFSDRFFVNVWPIFIVLLLSTFISFKKNKRIFYFSLAVCTTNLVLFAIDITQRLDLSLILPVQLWRWYETLFVLMAIPLCYFLFLTMMRFRYVFVFTLLVLMLQSTTTHNEPLVYASYSQDNVPDLIKKIETTRSDGLILTQGNGGETYRQVVIDTELGAHGLHTIYTDIRESSINSIFLRIAKKMISTEEEGWALINFTQSMNSNRLEIDSLGPLLHFLGINQIINVQTNESDAPGSIVFSKSRLYATTFLPPTFSIASAIAPQSRVSQIEAPLTLIFAENGFRDRKISDPTYTRFQEIALEKKLYARSIAFSPHTPVIEENVEEINKAKYIVFATLETKNITKAIEVIENALIHPDRKIFILANKDYADEYQEFVQKFARHKQVVFVDVRNNIFPFDEVILSIIASEPFDYKEDSLSVEMSNTNISITKQGKYMPLQSQHLTQTIWFIRQSYFPAWKAIDTQGNDVPLYLASPGYTLAFPDKNTSISLYFTTPHIVIIGHLISLLGLITLLTIALYKYKTKKTVR